VRLRTSRSHDFVYMFRAVSGIQAKATSRRSFFLLRNPNVSYLSHTHRFEGSVLTRLHGSSNESVLLVLTFGSEQLDFSPVCSDIDIYFTLVRTYGSIYAN